MSVQIELKLCQRQDDEREKNMKKDTRKYERAEEIIRKTSKMITELAVKCTYRVLFARRFLFEFLSVKF